MTASRRLYRIDRFTVPGAGREELLRRIEETHAVLRAQAGYVRDYILERENGGGGAGVLTFVEWDESARPESARDAVRAMHRQAGFDAQEMYARLGVAPDIGTYRLRGGDQSSSAAQGSFVADAAQDDAPRRAGGTYENDPADEVPFDDARDDQSLRRATVRRRYSGEIAGTSLAHVTIYRATPERLGYVATDRFEGSVAGRKGGFVFQHCGSIDRGVLRPFGYVVPGSGTGDLVGIAGDVRIAFTRPATHTIELTYRFL
jgi:hypothetical protein